MRILGINNTLSFTRRPKPSEEQGLRETINEAYNVLGTKERIVITHGSCFPASGRDTFIGSPYGRAAREYTKFLMLYGFNGNQLGPGGELQVSNYGIIPSPYNSSAFMKNRMFIDLEELTTDKYGKILSQDTYKKVTSNPIVDEKNYTLTDFKKARQIYDIALDESYKNFKTKYRNGVPEVLLLADEYKQFVDKHRARLTEEGIFKVLSKHYGTDNFERWDNDIDKDLIRLVKNGDKSAIHRYNKLLINNKKDINLHKFEQFIATKQIQENKQWREKYGFKYINDLLVGCSKADYWRCQDAFIDGYQLGAYEGPHNNPQTWGIPVLNPRMLFTQDGLGPAGKFLKDKIDYALEFCENLRVDHVMGLIEPYIIENKSLMYDSHHRLINNPYNNPINGQYMSKMKKGNSLLDDYKNYSCEYNHSNGHKTYHSNIMNKIVLPTLKEHGIAPEDVVWEDLCSNPEPFYKVFYEDLKLPGLTQLEFSKVEHSPKNNWHLVGSHDSDPAMKMIERDWVKNSDAWNPLYLAGYLNMDSKRAKLRDEFCKVISTDDRQRVNAKFVELLTSKKFQINFADLLGITEVVYNKPGTNLPSNWLERISPDYIEKYYKNLSSDNPTALNIPQILKSALQARIDMKVVSSKNPDEARKELNFKYKPLLDELQRYADILKEPEN